MKIHIELEVVGDSVFVAEANIIPDPPRRKPRTPVTKRQRYLCKLARDNGNEEAAAFIEEFVNTRGYRTGYDPIVKRDWPEFGALVPEWQ
jgi:hypothetical protein